MKTQKNTPIQKNKVSTVTLFAFIATSLLSVKLLAGEIIQVRDNRILIKADDGEFSEDQTVQIKDPDTFKVTGFAIIKKIKDSDGSVIAEVTKGNAKEYDLVVAGKSKSKRRVAQYGDDENSSMDESSGSDSQNPLYEAESESSSMRRKKKKNKQGSSFNPRKIKFGLGGGLINSTLSIKTNAIETTMTGSGFGFSLLMRIPFNSQINALGVIGIHPLSVSGSGGTGGSSTKVDISYYGFGGLIRYMFSRKGIGGWIGGGGHYLIPSSKSSNILSDSSMGTNYNFGVGGGYDMLINKNNLVVFSFEYAIFLPTSTSTTSSSGNQMILSAGMFF